MAYTFTGKACSVPLDYGPFRLEHSIILHPVDFESMVDLIYAPGPFVRDAKQQFEIAQGSQNNDLRNLPWQFHKGYLTVVIEPLTVPTQSTISSLTRYSSIYPDFLKAVEFYFTEGGAPAAGTMAVKRNEFKSLVQAAVTPMGKTFGGAYFAEFALDTHILLIKYIAPSPGSTFRRYQNKITPVTNNRIDKTTTTFLHFDLVIPKGTSKATHHLNTAKLRAQLAVDYICDTMVVDELMSFNVDAQPGKPEFFDAHAPLVHTPLSNGTPATLSQTQTTAGTKPNLLPARIDPTVIIDAVEHDPAAPSTPNPNPVCAIVNTMEPSDFSAQELAELKLKGYFQTRWKVSENKDDHPNKM